MTQLKVAFRKFVNTPKKTDCLFTLHSLNRYENSYILRTYKISVSGSSVKTKIT
jgi:hypothetical protein